MILQVEGRTQITIPCIIEKTDFTILDSPDDKANWRLRILSRNVDMFIDKVGKAISENGGNSFFLLMHLLRIMNR